MTNSFLSDMFNAARDTGRQLIQGRTAESSDDDDQWSDMTSSDGIPSPEKKAGQVADGEQYTTVDEEKDGRALLPYMPSLLGKDLPPCGLEPQVAYGNVNLEIRKCWLYFRGEKSLNDVCRYVEYAIHRQNTLPRDERTPWRRAGVMRYELRWIDYFVRESQITEPLTESELLNRRKESSIPPELGFRCSDKYALHLWEEWQKKKRVPSPILPDVVLSSPDTVVVSPPQSTTDIEEEFQAVV
ncbi:hypothetical protein P280DRAFT_66789 [Massarina eburnea CBS 473.64]|uniref:Uncharacterized protein n=1 Tax=Massarina eburnea CBS 473.64 TaxID=1395130 RepID=A0A6A6RXK0_9PLEO|nr:hypothetical protein P280DRAFT_66789 [Massarina eburnea CBS 473.64]